MEVREDYGSGADITLLGTLVPGAELAISREAAGEDGGVSPLSAGDGSTSGSDVFTALISGGAARIGISSGGAAMRYGDAGNGAAVEVDGSGITLSGFDADGSAGLSVTASGVTVNGQTVTTDDRVLPMVSGGGYITSAAAEQMINTSGCLPSRGGFTAIGLSEEQTTASGGEIVIDHTNPLFYFSSDIRLVAPKNATSSAYIQLERNLDSSFNPGVAIGMDAGDDHSFCGVSRHVVRLEHFHSAYETGIEASTDELLLRSERTGASVYGAYARFKRNGSIEGGCLSPQSTGLELGHSASFRFCDSGVSVGGELFPSVEITSGGMFISGAKVVTLPGSAGECLPASGGFVAVAEGGAAQISLSDNGAALIYSSGTVNNVLSVTASGAVLNGQELSVLPQGEIDSASTSAVIPVLSGGMSYRYTQPLSVLSVGSVVSTPEESLIRFTAASGGVAVSLPEQLEVVNGGVQFEASGSYVLAFRDGMMVAGSVTV